MNDLNQDKVLVEDLKTNLLNLIPWVVVFVVVQTPLLILGIWWQKAKPDPLEWSILVVMSMSLSFWLLSYLLRWHRKSEAIES